MISVSDALKSFRRYVIGRQLSNRVDELAAVVSDVKREAETVRRTAVDIANTPDPVATLAGRMRRARAR